MKDPDVVTFEIPRPWPSRSRHHDKPGTRFEWRYRHSCFPDDGPTDCTGCRGRSRAEMFPWWRPGSYSKFMVVAGRGLYWPSMLTVWHHDPSDYDFGSVCPRDSRWRWHLRHWRVQLPALQQARRRLLTRCSWCGGRSRKRDAVNVSHSWDGVSSKWWQGEKGLYHGECSTVENAWRTCTCDEPLLEGGRDYGTCERCERFRAWGQRDDWTHAAEVVRRFIPQGARDTARFGQIMEPLRRRRDDEARAEQGKP